MLGKDPEIPKRKAVMRIAKNPLEAISGYFLRRSAVLERDQQIHRHQTRGRSRELVGDRFALALDHDLRLRCHAAHAARKERRSGRRTGHWEIADKVRGGRDSLQHH